MRNLASRDCGCRDCICENKTNTEKGGKRLWAYERHKCLHVLPFGKHAHPKQPQSRMRIGVNATEHLADRGYERAAGCAHNVSR